MKRCIYVNPFVRYIERVRFCLGAVCQGPGFIRKTVEGEPFSFQKVWRVSAGFCLPKAEPLACRSETKHCISTSFALGAFRGGGRCIYPTA